MRNNIHVCLVGYGFHPPWNEGCAVIARDLALAIQDRVDLSMISVVDYFRGFKKQKWGDGIKTTHYINSNIFLKSCRYTGKYFLFEKMFDSIRIAGKLLSSKYRVNIVHLLNVSHLMISALTRMFLKTNIVAHVYGISRGNTGDILSKSLIDAYICTSEHNRICLRNKGIPSQKTHLIPPFVDCKTYRPLRNILFRRKRIIPYDEFVITYIGHVTSKRLPPQLLVEIAKLAEKRNDLRLLIYCPDTLVNRKISLRLKKLLSKFRIKYNFSVSNLNESDKVNVYNTSDVLIYPFMKDIPGTVVIDPPLTILEGMACGKIVVASRVLSLPRFIEDGKSGFLVDPGDFEGFKNTLESVIEKSFQLDDVGLKARKTVQKQFSSEVIIPKVLDIYKSIID